jgi:acetylornithine/N-succinyldiaminopimelate aminotransferase
MLKGLIPGQQKPTHLSKDHWQFGTVMNGIKKIDPLLHYGCFTLGFDRIDIIQHVCDSIKNIKPEIAESTVHEEDLKLNHASYELSNKLFNISNGYRSFFALSGSDANEGAVKLSSAYHSIKKNKNKNKIVSFYHSFHGCTFLNSNLGDLLVNNPLYTMNRYDGIIRLNRDFDLDSVDWNQVMSIIVETCSWGNDLTPNSDIFWEKIKHIQQKFDVILIVDDIFIGGGKTGNFIGWKHLPIQPDIFTMGKSITGGYFPLSITMYNEKIHNILPVNFEWDHGYTYSFSLPGINSVLKYIDILEKEQILDKYQSIQNTAIKTIQSTGFEILNCFGCLYMIRKGNFKNLYMIPLNATDEYFTVLKQDLDYYDNKNN